MSSQYREKTKETNQALCLVLVLTNLTSTMKRLNLKLPLGSKTFNLNRIGTSNRQENSENYVPGPGTYNSKLRRHSTGYKY